MLKQIKIHNFQGHADTTVEIADHVTAIVGLNNHGKSAIFRACRKVLRDYPDGSIFIREKQKQCSIEVTTDSGIIERIIRNDKAVDSNVYKVNGMQFTKFAKTGIPTEVLERTEVSLPQQFGDIEFDINFQNQLDPLFLISGDGLASIRGKVIGRVSGVDYAERAVQMASAEIKSISRDIEQNLNDRIQNEEKLEKYCSLPRLFEELAGIDTLQNQQDDLDRKIEYLIKIQEDILNIISEVTGKNKIIKILDVNLEYDLYDVDRLSNNIQSVLYCIDLMNQMQISDKIIMFDIPSLNDMEWYKSIVTLVDNVLNTRSNLEILNRVDSIVVPDIKSLEELDNRLEFLKKLKSELYVITSDYNVISNDIISIEKQLIIDEQEMESLKKELGICPLCNRPFED